jgi:hypothetical protein
MNKENKIALASKCGLVCTNNGFGSLQDFEPEFMGTEKEWRAYDEALQIEEENNG